MAEVCRTEGECASVGELASSAPAMLAARAVEAPVGILESALPTEARMTRSSGSTMTDAKSTTCSVRSTMSSTTRKASLD